MPPGNLFQLMGPWYANARSPYDFAFAVLMVNMFGSDDDLSGRAGVNTHSKALQDILICGSQCCVV